MPLPFNNILQDDVNKALAPTQLLSLNCLVFGDNDPQKVFTVKILKTDNVSILKDLKKAHRFAHVDASDLELWNDSFPVDNLSSEEPSIVGPDLPPNTKVSSFVEDQRLLGHFGAQLNPLFRNQITNFSINQVAANVFDEPDKLADFAAAISMGEVQEL